MLEGDADAWLLEFRSLGERLGEAVEAVWPMCVRPLVLAQGAMTHEDDITNQLVGRLVRSKALPGRIVPQYTLLVEDEGDVYYQSSNIDFVLTVGDDEDVYVACECKRLNVPYPRRTRWYSLEYIDEGLMRFITGQYSKGLPIAMMIGYVMDRQVAAARTRLRLAFSRRRARINMVKSVDHPVNAEKPLRFLTTHRCVSGANIDVAHTLLAWP